MSGLPPAFGVTSAPSSCWKRRRRAGTAPWGTRPAGASSPGSPADFVTVSLDGPGLAGVSEDFLLEAAVFAAGAGDVTNVVAAGRAVVVDGQHVLVGDVAAALRSAIGALASLLS